MGESSGEGKGVAGKGRHQWDKDEVIPQALLAQTDKGGEKIGDEHGKEEGPPHFLQGHGVVAGDGHHEDQQEVKEDTHQSRAHALTNEGPEGDDAGQGDGQGGDLGVFDKTRRPEHLVDSHHREGRDHNGQEDGRQQVEDHKDQRDAHHRHKNTFPHGSYASKPAGASLIGRQRLVQLFLGEIRPEHVGKVKFGIGRLP